MNNIKKIINLANNIANCKNLKNNFAKLAVLFKEEYAFNQEIAVLKAIYNLTKDSKKLEEIGDIYANELNIKEAAQEYYNKYLQVTDTEFYKKYVSANDIKTKEEICIPQDLQERLDCYNVFIEIIVFLHGRKFYQEILNLKDDFFKLEEFVATWLVENEYSNLDELEKINDKKNYLSCVLSNTGNHNDINRFAIELNPKNEAGYLNIIDDLVYYKNYKQALDMYNSEYVKMFPENKYFDNIVDLCWFLSDKLYRIGQYFNAIERQKFAIDIELENREKSNA